MARRPHYRLGMTHLQTIETRQKQSRARDLMFAAFVVMATALGVSALLA
jgi:hypothetical protein